MCSDINSFHYNNNLKNIEIARLLQSIIFINI